MKLTTAKRVEIVDRILVMKKYRGSGLNQDTILDLIDREAPRQSSIKALNKAVRRKLHNIVAPYLGEPDYASLSEHLAAVTNASPQSPEIQALCLDVLRKHASTAERVPHQVDFYRKLFNTVGTPDSILDLACGLHPLAYPWMGLPTTVEYHAYDIIQPRIDFINQFFLTIGLKPLAENRDILVHPPQIRADLGIFFKEAHRFEKRQPGCNRRFWSSLNVDTLAVSLPIRDLAGTHSLLDQHRKLVENNIDKTKIRKELLFENEIVFLIEHPGGD
jgi:16S rRNA (guanine(1405)-N(7))-methyltransferase